MTKEELLLFIQTENSIAKDFLDKAKNFQGDIYLYGAGNYLPFAVRFMQMHQVPVKAILDSRKSGSQPSLQDGYDGDIPIISFDEFMAGRDPMRICWFVISAPSAEESIRSKLTQYFQSECIFAFEMEIFLMYPMEVEEYRRYLVQHWAELSELYDTLFDDQSRETLVSMIKGRLTGNLTYFQQCCVSDQYYPADIVHFSKGEIMAELGAYDGKTLLQFIQRCPDYQSVYCFEPDRNLLAMLDKIREEQALLGKTIYIIPKAAWSSGTVLRLSSTGTVTGDTHILEECAGEQSYFIETAAVDEVVKEPISYMKMDIEGSELEALHGAARQIVENRPKLAVCVYHRNSDILDIWNYLRELTPAYYFYLRHHNCTGTETVLYAIPKD